MDTQHVTHSPSAEQVGTSQNGGGGETARIYSFEGSNNVIAKDNA
jgi:hypothetical protein